MPTKKTRLMITTPPELEAQLYELRGHDDFKGCSMSEILRRLLMKGLEMEGYPKEKGVEIDQQTPHAEVV